MIYFIKRSLSSILFLSLFSTTLTAMEPEKTSNSFFGWLSSVSSLSSASLSSISSSSSLPSSGSAIKITDFFTHLPSVSFEHGPVHAAVAAALIPWNGRTDIPLNAWKKGQLTELCCLDGIILRAHWREVQAGGKTMLLFHGNGMISDEYEATAEWFAQKGYNSLAFTIRGYPGSEGSSDELPVASVLDTEAAIRFLVQDKQIPYEKICAYGYSLGGFYATYAARHFPLGGLILKSSPTTVSDLIRNVAPSWLILTDTIVKNVEESFTQNHNGMPQTMSLGLFENEDRIPLNSLDNLENLQNKKIKNLMIIYGTLDTLTGGVAGAKKLRASFGPYLSPFCFVPLENGAHGTSWLNDDRATILVEMFIRDINK